ncbi:pseudouridine synthase [Panaeolus papilionaceus]|nr:pseudouridine synthase [Panaeolus papilionaceus]
MTDNTSKPKGKEPANKRLSERKEKKNGRGRGGRRTRDAEDAAAASGEAGSGKEVDGTPKAPRYPKRQCALLMGFCGSGYSGMQIQPDHTRTIEGVLFQALVKVGAVSQDNADNPTKVGLARAARTDAGVHAAGNVVSLKMILTIPGVKDIIARINEELPPEIRLWGYCRVQNSFNARLVCESRKYTYFFPTYLLIPPKPGSGIHKIWTERGEEFPGMQPSLSSPFWEGVGESTKEEDLARKRAWRASPEHVEGLRSLVYKYLGTHNFHNFTVGRDFNDRSNFRYMKKIEISDPVVYGDTEWISVLFHGQSFMLHQRKMMSILVLSCRMGTPARVISELYGQRPVFVPKMPALGLLLEEPLFDAYNQRMAVINEKFKPTDPDYRPPIDFDVYRDQMNAFKEKYIYKNMREIEDRDALFDAWVRSIDAYAGNDLLYLNATGNVPDVAVINKSGKRANPFREKRVFDITSFPENDEIKKKLEAEDEGDVESDSEAKLDKKQLEETEG